MNGILREYYFGGSMRYLCGVFGGIIKGNRGRNIKYFVKEFECILKV